MNRKFFNQISVPTLQKTLRTSTTNTQELIICGQIICGYCKTRVKNTCSLYC